MTTWDEITELLARRRVAHGHGAKDDEIANAESALGVRFPDELREYLHRIGWIDHGMGYYGVGNDVPGKALDLVENTRCEREDAEPSMQHHLVPILNNGGGDHWCVDTRSGEVVRWNHELDEDQTPEFVDASLAAWMLERLRDALADDMVS
jgi:cell wall assembly regulator SMI1